MRGHLALRQGGLAALLHHLHFQHHGKIEKPWSLFQWGCSEVLFSRPSPDKKLQGLLAPSRVPRTPLVGLFQGVGFLGEGRPASQ
jgi:hypothetical protein